MNWDQVAGEWEVIKGNVREKWGKLTNDDLEGIGGKKDRLLGKLQSYYGHKKEVAERELEEFISKIKKAVR